MSNNMVRETLLKSILREFSPTHSLTLRLKQILLLSSYLRLSEKRSISFRFHNQYFPYLSVHTTCVARYMVPLRHIPPDIRDVRHIPLIAVIKLRLSSLISNVNAEVKLEVTDWQKVRNG